MLSFDALCLSYGIESSSWEHICQSLGINVSLNEKGCPMITLPDHIFEGDYIARGRLSKEIEAYYNISPSQAKSWQLPVEKEHIIESYPYCMRPLVLSLIRFSIEAEKNNQESSKNFLHNARWLLVPVKDEEGRWHPADLRTLWSDGWREQEIICFMISKPVKYIVHHNDKMIECLNLKNEFYVFEIDKTNK